MKPRSAVRWMIISLIAVATVINYIDRNALAVMWPEITKEIGATKEDYALLVTVFMVFYATGQFTFGWLFDKIGTRMGFALSIAAWSVSIALHAVARGIFSFSIFRALLAFSEAGAGHFQCGRIGRCHYFSTVDRGAVRMAGLACHLCADRRDGTVVVVAVAVYLSRRSRQAPVGQ